MEKNDKLLLNIEKNHMKGFLVNNREELIELLNQLIENESTVGCGDSVTLEDLGIYDYLREKNITFYDKYEEGLSKEGKRDIYLNNFRADSFITGTNALTLDGKLFNIDGNGSRVAPMIYGPNQVIVVVGRNKLVDTVEQAIKRTREIAAPLDAKRLNKETPCAKIGKCVDCRHSQRICNDFVLIT